MTSAFVLVAVFALQHPAFADAGTFVDDDNSRWEGFIEAARAEGIVNGCNPPKNDRFCPNDVVTRADMAVMLARATGVEHAKGDHFADDDGHYAEGAIEALIGAGMRFGCDPGRFCPDRPITREEMAAFISRTLGWDTDGRTASYSDLTRSPMSGAIVELARRGALEPCDAPVDSQLCPRSGVSRDEAAFSLVKSLGLQPRRVTVEERELEPIDFGDSFDELALWDGRSPGYRNRVRLTGDGFKATALDVRIPRGSHFGADFRLDLSRTVPDEPERLFFRYFLRFDPDWATETSGKLPGFSGVYGSTGKGGYQSRPWEPGWSARLMFKPAEEGDRRVRLGYYVYHLGQRTRFGDKLTWNESGRLLPGEWYCLEGEVELNSLGLSDGALRAWVDGTPAFDASGLEFRRPSEPEIRIESFWFNVYYGGKQVPNRDLGLTIDEVVVDTKRVGCEAGGGTGRTVRADFNSDGYADRLWWGNCPGGACFLMQAPYHDGGLRTFEVGSGAWFSLESHRLGMAAGDVDGDGATDVLYRGRCAGSVRCWRVHRNVRGDLGIGQNWGDGARFSPSTAALALGDWNGDGRDDLVYQGTCGDNAHACWRLHPSSGKGLKGPRDWGRPPKTPVFPSAADINGDGLDDLVYQAPCKKAKMCWVAQRSLGNRFAKPKIIGAVRDFEAGQHEIIDFDGDGDDDLVAWNFAKGSTRVEVRFTGPKGLGKARTIARIEGRAREVFMRRVGPGAPVQALVRLDCEKRPCLEYLVAPTARSLVDPEQFHDAIRRRYRVPLIV